MTQKWKTNPTTSKIHKLHINGKPKRPGTQQYPYLGPTVAMVARKLDPTVGQTCFHRIFQTVRHLPKRTTGMSSEGPKMGGVRYGSVWNGRKIGKSGDPLWRPPPHSLIRSGRVRRRLAGKFRRRGRLTLLLFPEWRVCKGGGQNRLPWPKPVWPKNGSKRPCLGSTGFGEFSRVLEVKMSVLGLGFYLESKTRFI